MDSASKTVSGGFLAAGPLLRSDGLVDPLFGVDAANPVPRRRRTFGDVRSLLSGPPDDAGLPVPPLLRAYFSEPRPPEHVMYFLRGAAAPGRWWLTRVLADEGPPHFAQNLRLRWTTALLYEPAAVSAHRNMSGLDWEGSLLRRPAHALSQGETFYEYVWRVQQSLIRGVDPVTERLPPHELHLRPLLRLPPGAKTQQEVFPNNASKLIALCWPPDDPDRARLELAHLRVAHLDLLRALEARLHLDGCPS